MENVALTIGQLIAVLQRCRAGGVGVGVGMGGGVVVSILVLELWRWWGCARILPAQGVDVGVEPCREKEKDAAQLEFSF